MKQYLIDTFGFNDWANKLTLSAMADLADKDEAVAIFSHLITAQDKWMLRIKNDPKEAAIKWWDTPFKFEELGGRWNTSLGEWLRFLWTSDASHLDKEVIYTTGPDDTGNLKLLRDVVLQLNYHSILHRAEICLRIKDQGLEPPHVDYVYYKREESRASAGSF